MSRYRGPKLKIIRRLGNLPGLTSKNTTLKKSDSETNKKKKEYTIRLEEKQKLKFNYGLTEKQLFGYIQEARRRSGVTGLNLLQLLEMRLDSICFALGFASTIGSARQIINHGHVMVNNSINDIPSFQCKINDTISLSSKIKSKVVENNILHEIPNHLNFDKSVFEGQVTDYCQREDILLNLNELLVIEYYSRR
jgi:small subunit ribosomal protein S4